MTPPPISPEDFAAILGPKGGSTATANTDWSTAFESSASAAAAGSSSSHQHLRPDTRRPIDVANSLAASEATFHAFANDGADVLGFLGAHAGPLDLDDVDGIFDHAWRPTSDRDMLPHMQDGWHIMEPPTHSVHAREHWDHWAREFLATVPPAGVIPDGAAVTAYARNQLGGLDYVQDVWNDEAIEAWDQALRRGKQMRNKSHHDPNGQSPSWTALDQGEIGQEEDTSLNKDLAGDANLSQRRAVDRIRSIIGHLRYMSPPSLTDPSSPTSQSK
ncbi:hypothetical protein BCR44DRAFT_1425333 [Catenaria anguillulae PL171]|uniref:Uncharacterized protein n=1 Tax=Catenaria anguillulae PL171 TaxID=765915 RepID=A0A1Y2I4Z0_9FUNG|nr:hypothetical protein BCR44DRAFT_1425333 [Catenaria anguillulae PL171]